MLVSLAPTAFADTADNKQVSTFDFGASDYAFNENDGTVTIKITRSGAGDSAARLSVKAADMLSEYGEDYEIVDTKGKPFERVEGFKPDVSEFEFSTSGDQSLSEAAKEFTLNESSEEETETNDQSGKKTVTKRKSTGSPLLDAQADYLNLPAEMENVEVETNSQKLLNETYEYFKTAQGAQGVVEFGIGETEKEITLNISDNADPNAQKLFMLSIMGTDNPDKTTVAPNATTFVTIQDDEAVVPSTYSIKETELLLNSKASEGQITITRQGGDMYISTVTLSTVTLTAPEGSYEEFSEKTVAFMPGETEKKVDIKALNFYDGGRFGVRLDIDSENDTLGNRLVEVTIARDPNTLRERSSAEMNELESGIDELSTEKLADTYEVGNSSVEYRFVPNDSTNMYCTAYLFGSEGSFDYNGGKLLWGNWFRLQRNYRWGTWFVTTPSKIDFRGVKSLDGFYDSVGKFAAYQNVVNEIMHSNQGVAGTSQKGQNEPNWPARKNFSINTKDLNDSYYVALGHQSADDWKGSWSCTDYCNKYTLKYAKVTFDNQPSCIDYDRNLYDFSTGTPKINKTFFDNSNKQFYTPGPVRVRTSWNRTVTGFYANADQTVYVEAADPAKEAGNGMFLEGVYITCRSKGEMGDGYKYEPEDKFIYLPVTNGSKDSDNPFVELTLNRDFFKQLREKRIISDNNDCSIKIYPKYTKHTRSVTFYNTDRPKGVGAYNNMSRYSEISNIIEAYKRYQSASDNEKKSLPKITYHDVNLTKPVSPQLENFYYYGIGGIRMLNISKYHEACDEYERKIAEWNKAISEGGGSYYEVEIEEAAVVNVSVSPDNTKTSKGISYKNKATNNKPEHTWLKAGEHYLDNSNKPEGFLQETGDYYRAQFIVRGDTSVIPVTSDQSFTLMYFPDEKIPIEYKGERAVEKVVDGKIQSTVYRDLEKAVVVTDTIAEEGVEPIGVDEKGTYEVPNAFTGMEFSFTANPPTGYVTMWVDMTGDLDGSGHIEENEVKAMGRTTSSPETFYGNVFHGKIEGDNPRMYYQFVRKTSITDTRFVDGIVRQEDANFIMLENNSTSITYKPIPDAMVNVGGTMNYTNEKGEYKFQAGLPAAGYAELSVGKKGRSTYYTYTGLKSYNTITVPALECFKAESIKADLTYKKDGKNEVTETQMKSASEGRIQVENGKLVVEVRVSAKTALIPSKSRWYINDKDGNEVVNCAEDEDYTIEDKLSNGVLTSRITFNPNKHCIAGYKLSVQFADQTGYWYNPIETGYRFFAPLKLDNFIFPMLGSSTLESVYRSGIAQDLIGNPLGDISLESIGLTSNTEAYSPSALSEDARANTQWIRTSYSFAWGKDYKIVDKKWSTGDKKDSDKDKKDSDKDKKDSDKDKKDSDNAAPPANQDSDNAAPPANQDSDNAAPPANKDSDNAAPPANEDTDNAAPPATSGSAGLYASGGAGGNDLDEKASETLKEATETLENDTEIQEQSGTKKGKDDKQAKYKTKGSLNFSLSPSLGFRLNLSMRSADDKYYFEDLLFYAKIGAKLAISEEIALPIGISITMGIEFNGSVTAIYYMYNNYNGDPLEGGYGETENEYLVPFDSDNFGLFKKFDEGSTIRRDFYLFIDPTLSISLGVKVGIIAVSVTATFAFDMDWRFTKWNTYSYGNMKMSLTLTIKALGIKVYSTNIGGKNLVDVKLFSGPTDSQGPISFDTSKPFTTPSGAGGEVEEGVFSTSDLPERGDRSAWAGTPDTPNADIGTTERTLETGSEADAQVRLMKINDAGDMLMVFIDDDHSRTAINRRALYYSISSGDNWSTPKLLDKDGTLDDYPDICDIGNGKFLVSWSSASEVLPETAGIEDALQALEIKVSFFDTETREFSKPEQLTKKTDLDYTADTAPHAAYDAETDRIILYYTKTEYEGIEKIEDIGSAASVNAYLFYEDGKWSNDGSFYGKDEFPGVDEVTLAKYKKGFYGQRFLDLRTTSDSELKLAVDSAAASFNGLGLYAWTVDNDKDLNTTNDRDIFMQIYEFETNTFTHVIKLNQETGTFTSPKFVDSGNRVYLFFGTKSNDEEEQHGQIMYLNMSDVVGNGYFTKQTDTGRDYYTLDYVSDFDGQMTYYSPSEAAPTDNIQEFQVTVSDDDRMYLFWNDKVDNAVQIKGAYYVGDSAPNTNGWSNGVTLTNAGEDMYYTGIGAAVVGSDIKLGAVKSNYRDETDNSIVYINHAPFADVGVASVSADKELPMPGDIVTVTAVVENKGLLGMTGNIDVDFEVNGEKANTVTLETGVDGASEVEVMTTIEIPDTEDDIVIAATANGDKKEITLKRDAELELDKEFVGYFTDSPYGKYYAYSAGITNVGNKEAKDLAVHVFVNDEEKITYAIDEILPGETEEVKLPIETNNALYKIDDTGLGTIDFKAFITYGDKQTEEYTYIASKQFDMDTVKLLEKVTDVKVGDDFKVTMDVNEAKKVAAELSGVTEDELTVVWESSSDPSVAEVDREGTIISNKPGKTTIVGHVVPNKQYIEFDSTGACINVSPIDTLPVDKVITVGFELTVSGSADGILGDVNGDGAVDSADALKALRASVGAETLTDDAIPLADIDGDGQITSADALSILRYSVGLIDNEQIGKPISA